MSPDFDVRLVRDPRPPASARASVAERGGAIAPDGPQHIFVPVMRGRSSSERWKMERFGPRVAPWAWWRLGLALCWSSPSCRHAGGVANSAGRAAHAARQAADRFGGGDLAFRTDVAVAAGAGRCKKVQEVAVQLKPHGR